MRTITSSTVALLITLAAAISCAGEPGACVDDPDTFLLDCGADFCQGTCGDPQCVYISAGCEDGSCYENSVEPDNDLDACAGCGQTLLHTCSCGASWHIAELKCPECGKEHTFRRRVKRPELLRIRKKKVSNDSCEYAWIVFGLPGGGGRWERLEEPALQAPQATLPCAA